MGRGSFCPRTDPGSDTGRRGSRGSQVIAGWSMCGSSVSGGVPEALIGAQPTHPPTPAARCVRPPCGHCRFLCVGLPLAWSSVWFAGAVPHAWQWALGAHVFGWYMQVGSRGGTDRCGQGTGLGGK